jgi:hypothetical protein
LATQSIQRASPATTWSVDIFPVRSLPRICHGHHARQNNHCMNGQAEPGEFMAVVSWWLFRRMFICTSFQLSRMFACSWKYLPHSGKVTSLKSLIKEYFQFSF